MKTLTRPLIGTGIGRIPGAKRLYARVGSSLMPESERVVDMGWAQIEVNVAGRGLDGMAAALVFERKYEPLTTEIVKKIVKPGMNAVDVGANIGYYTLLLASLVGKGGRVWSVEPDRDNFDTLVRNIGRQLAAPTPFHRIALSDSEGEAAFYLSDRESGEHSLIRGRAKATREVKVLTTTLDKLMGVNPVDFIKIDVEGNERKVVAGGWGTLKAKRNERVKVIMEFWPEGLRLAAGGYTHAPQALWAMMRGELGFGYAYIVDEVKGEVVRGVSEEAIARCEGRGRKQSVNVVWSRENLDEVIL